MGKIELGNKNTMLELQYASNHKSSIKVAEVLTQTNRILEDAPWFKANSGFNNIVVQRSSLGAGQKRQFNDGVEVTANGKLQFVDGSIMQEAYSEVDAALADAGGPGYRASEDAAIVEGMSQDFARLLFYDKKAADEPMSLNGLSVRLGSIATDQCLSASGSSNCSSIYIVQWGEAQAHLFYPDGIPNYGVAHNDLGKNTAKTSAGKQYEIYRSHFKIYGGLSVRDGRSIKRVANIDTADLDGFEDFEDILIALLNKLPQNSGKTVIYCNSDVQTLFDIRAKDKLNVQYGTHNVWGEPQLYFRNVPVKRCDAISSDETVVT